MAQHYLFSKIQRLKDQLHFLLRLLPQKCNTPFNISFLTIFYLLEAIIAILTQ